MQRHTEIAATRQLQETSKEANLDLKLLVYRIAIKSVSIWSTLLWQLQ